MSYYCGKRTPDDTNGSWAGNIMIQTPPMHQCCRLKCPGWICTLQPPAYAPAHSIIHSVLQAVVSQERNAEGQATAAPTRSASIPSPQKSWRVSYMLGEIRPYQVQSILLHTVRIQPKLYKLYSLTNVHTWQTSNSSLRWSQHTQIQHSWSAIPAHRQVSHGCKVRIHKSTKAFSQHK